MECAVCGKPGRKRRGIKRVLCDDCAQVARNMTNRSRLGGNPGYHEEFSSPPKNISVPIDGNLDTWEWKNRRLEE
jgi:hypothetical protein